MLWACVLLPQLALDGALRQQPEINRPLALVTGPAHLRTLHSVNTVAAEAGLVAGMRLSAAHALVPDFTVLEYKPAAEAHWQDFLASWAYRYSSQVSKQWPGCLLLEVEASFKLLGPWPQIQARMRKELALLGFTHHIALAPTPGAARVLSGLHDGWGITQFEPMQTALDQVPVQHAGLPDAAGERLWRMGIRTLGMVRRLPHDALRRRFGVALPHYLDRLYGHRAQTLTFHAPPDHFDLRLELGHEVESHSALLFPLRRLINDLCTFLSVRDGAVQRFVLRLEHEHGHHDVDVGLLAVEREPALLFELVRTRLEQARLERPVVALRLLAREILAFVPASRDLFELKGRHAASWLQVRERLRARLGEDAVQQIGVACDPRPERAWQWLKESAAPGSSMQPSLPARPLWLLPRPIPLRDRNPRIISGPERLESGWWDGADARRDYYVLETSFGQHAWVFAPAGEQGQWMLHGWFA